MLASPGHKPRRTGRHRAFLIQLTRVPAQLLFGRGGASVCEKEAVAASALSLRPSNLLPGPLSSRGVTRLVPSLLYHTRLGTLKGDIPQL